MYTSNSEQRRKQLIKLIHVARRELGMQDEDYRSMLASMPALGGKTSSADIGITGLDLILAQLKQRGFKVKPKTAIQSKSAMAAQTRPLADDAQSKMIRSLWLSLHDLGAVRNPSESALASYVCRIAKVEALQWLDSVQAIKVIETLKKWQKRAKKSVNGIGS